MGSYRKPRRRFNRSISRDLPFVLDEKGEIDVLASVEDRVKLAEKAGIPYVYMELEKSNGRQVKFLVRTENFKKMTKADINKLFKGLT